MPRPQYDFYETPPHYTRALIDVIGQPKGVVYDCCVGEGKLVRRFSDYTTLLTNDLDRQRPADTHFDATKHKAWGTLGIDWCITNPPFSDELPILINALQFCRNVAFLARLSFLEPTLDRAPFWQRHADRCTVIVLPRYSFRPNDDGKRRTDSVTCCWLVWWEAQKRGGFHVSQRRMK